MSDTLTQDEFAACLGTCGICGVVSAGRRCWEHMSRAQRAASYAHGSLMCAGRRWFRRTRWMASFLKAFLFLRLGPRHA